MRETLRLISDAGAQPYLCEYSPIPGTKLWESACRVSSLDLPGEPLTHNNTFFACRRPDFTYEDLLALKEEAHRARASTRALESYPIPRTVPPQA